MENTVTISLRKYEEMKSDLEILDEVRNNSEFIIERTITRYHSISYHTNSITAKDLINTIENLEESHTKKLKDLTDRAISSERRCRELEIENSRFRTVPKKKKWFNF